MSRHRFHGDPTRFTAVATAIAEAYGNTVTHIADVAGGQGMLARQLNKAGYRAEVIDPRGWTLAGVPSRAEEYSADMADYYDLVVGVHPDQALRAVVESAPVRPVVVIPCCNFWDRSVKLGRSALLEELGSYLTRSGVPFEQVTFDFTGPQNIGVMTGALTGRARGRGDRI